MVTVRKASVPDAIAMAEILREIGWSEKRNSMQLDDVAGPIKRLVEHSINDPDGHTTYVAIDDEEKVIGFTNVHWVPFVMLGGIEGYVSDLFVSPSSGGKGAGQTTDQCCNGRR